MPAGIYARKYTTIEEYLTKRSKRHESGCIIWVGSKTWGGYGTAKWRDQNTIVATTAHRAAYQAFVGPIPDGLEIDHKCKNRLCINPDHLEAVTHYENVQRSSVAGRTHCKYGHLFDRMNTFIKSNGMKSCRACNARRQRELRAKKSSPTTRTQT
jgi:hypothetical protein